MTNQSLKKQAVIDGRIALWWRHVNGRWNPFHHLWRHSEPTLTNVETWQASGPKKTKGKPVATMAMIMNTTKKKQEHLSRNTNQIKGGGEEKLLFLLTRFIRKENLDKRGCKITEIVERHKIKADPIFWDQFISGMNCVGGLFFVGGFRSVRYMNTL